jgi:2-amino-4-hydroxy-6-hydroxymethyldihydropteridine diphosphokinase
MTRAYIGLGSNVGNRLQYLQRAVQCLDNTHGVQVTAVSSVYETAPVGPPDQSWFLNAVAAMETSLSPPALLELTQGIERGLGRETPYRWGPRSIDLDILLYGHTQLHTQTLVIPHVEICQRAFVMTPLLELDPHLVLPDGTALKTCLSDLSPPQQVRYFAPPSVFAAWFTKASPRCSSLLGGRSLHEG